MAGEWEDVALQDVADELTVGYVGSMSSEYVDEGVPFLRSLNVEPLRINNDDLKYVSRDFHERISKSRLTPGDVVIVRTGKPGACAVIPQWLSDANCSDLVIVRCGKRINNCFLAYYVNTVASGHIAAHLVGAVQQHFNVGSARTLRIRLPPLPEQKRIAHILGTLDDKIELNRRMNATLEGISRAIFKSWFVEFDPVRQKAAGKQPVGMDAQTAALFPDSFEDSEFGEVPKGWRVGAVGDCADLNPQSWSRATYPDEVRYVDLSSTKWGEVEAVERYERESAPSRAQRILCAGDTIFGTVRPGNGSFAFVEEDGLTGSTGFAVLRPKRRKFREYVYLATTNLDNVDRLAHLADGGAYPSVRPEVVADTPVIVAPPDVVERFSDLTSACFARLGSNRRESRTLATLRDTLLPKLLSGEIRVPEAEGMVEEAVG